MAARTKRSTTGLDKTVKQTVRRVQSTAARRAGGGAELMKAVQGLVKAIPVAELEKRLNGLERSVEKLEVELRKAAERVGIAVRGTATTTTRRAAATRASAGRGPTKRTTGTTATASTRTRAGVRAPRATAATGRGTTTRATSSARASGTRGAVGRTTDTRSTATPRGTAAREARSTTTRRSTVAVRGIDVPTARRRKPPTDAATSSNGRVGGRRAPRKPVASAIASTAGSPVGVG